MHNDEPGKPSLCAAADRMANLPESERLKIQAVITETAVRCGKEELEWRPSQSLEHRRFVGWKEFRANHQRHDENNSEEASDEGAEKEAEEPS